MRLRYRARVVFAAAAATALAAGLATVPALAAVSAPAPGRTWTVTPGGTYLGDAHDNLWELVDLSTNMKIKCSPESSNFSRELVQFKSGSGLVNPIGKVTAAAFPQACMLPTGGQSFNVIPGGLPWPIRAFLYDASKGETRGKLYHVHLALSGPTCSAVIDGTGPTANDGIQSFGHFNGSDGYTSFRSGGDLHAYNVTGCTGFLSSGDPVAILYAYSLTGNTAPTITSP